MATKAQKAFKLEQIILAWNELSDVTARAFQTSLAEAENPISVVLSNNKINPGEIQKLQE